MFEGNNVFQNQCWTLSNFCFIRSISEIGGRELENKENACETISNMFDFDCNVLSYVRNLDLTCTDGKMIQKLTIMLYLSK